GACSTSASSPAGAVRRAAARGLRRRQQRSSSCHASLLPEGAMALMSAEQLVVGTERCKLYGDLRHRHRIGLEALAHVIEIGQSPGIQLGIDRLCQLGLAGALMRKEEQPDHRATRVPLVALSQQRLESARIGLPREQMITIDKIEQRHRLFPQRMNHVPVIDDITAFVAFLGSPAAPQSQNPRRAEEAFEPVVVEMHTEVMTDEPRGDGIEHFVEQEAAARRHPYPLLLVVAGSPQRQFFQGRPLKLKPFAVLGVVAPDYLVDKATISSKILELA